MTTHSELRQCDYCGAETEYCKVGPYEFQGWVKLMLPMAATDNTNPANEWDFCSLKCAYQWLADRVVIRK
jgi:hypothetical protein